MRSWSHLVAVVLLALGVVLAALVVPAPPAGATAVDDEAQLTAALNDLRASLGLPRVATDARLVQVARSWSARMAASGDLAHNAGLDAEAPPGDFLKENVAVGPDMVAIHAGLVASRTHYDVMVHPMPTAVGIGVVHDGPRRWVTQVFLRPPVIEPALSIASSGAGAAGAGEGYRLVTADGGVAAFGTSSAMPAAPTAAPTTAGASTPSGAGYWVADTAGRVSARGDAGWFGDLGGVGLSAPIVGLAATPSGRGYWLLGRDGGVFSFGDAGFFGSTGALRLNSPVVALAPTTSGHGYWFVAADGGIFSFGDAGFFGSTGALRLNSPVVGMAATASGAGYWLVARDGGVFTFGDAPFLGSTGDLVLAQPIVGIRPSAGGAGYRFGAADGGVFSFGDAPFLGSLAGVARRTVVALLAP